MPIPLKQKVRNYEGTLVNQLINYVENPDSLGFIDGLWYSPKYDRRYSPVAHDKNNFGEGIDRNKNEYVKNGELKFHKDALGREYITPEEERNTRHHVLANAEESYGNRLKFAQKTMNSSKTPSEMKKALTMSAIYNLGAGTVSNELFESRALMDSLLNGSDLGYSNQVNRYYTEHRVPSRGPKTNEFVEQYVPVQQDIKIEREPYFSNLKERLNDTFQSAVKTVSKTGSWAYGGDMNNKFAGGGKKSWNSESAEKAIRYFMGKGMARHQAAGLVGNFIRESQLNPQAVNKYSGAYGIAQWLGPRKEKLFAMYGPNPTFDQELEFAWHELNNTHKSGLQHLLASKDAEEAARMGMGYYEFQAGPEGAIRAMKKWGQDGEKSMREGINYALGLMGGSKPVGQDIKERVRERYGNYEETPVFMPRNPEAFFAPLSTYTRPVVAVEPEQPLVDMAALQAREQREAERQQRRDGLNLLLGMLGNNGSNGYLEMLSSLLGG